MPLYSSSNNRYRSLPPSLTNLQPGSSARELWILCCQKQKEHVVIMISTNSLGCQRFCLGFYTHFCTECDVPVLRTVRTLTLSQAIRDGCFYQKSQVYEYTGTAEPTISLLVSLVTSHWVLVGLSKRVTSSPGHSVTTSPTVYFLLTNPCFRTATSCCVLGTSSVQKRNVRTQCLF